MKYSSIARATVASAALFLGVTGATAGDNNGNFMVRVQGTYVVTQDDVKSLKIDGTELKATHDARVSDEFIPTLTLTYFLNKNVAVELFCCFANVDVTGKAALSGLGQIADTWIFPPILTAQYHFDPVMGIKPYVGAGVQFIHYFDSKKGDSIGGTVEFKDSWGFALQAGLDYQLGGGWYANLDVKKVWLDTEVTWKQPLAGVNTIHSKVDVDPLIISAGVGYRFNLEDIFGSRSSATPLK